MATVTAYTAARSKAIEDRSIIASELNPLDGHLIFTLFDGSKVDVGKVTGTDATALLQVADSDDTGLLLEGDGTPAHPWVLTSYRRSPTPYLLSGDFAGAGRSYLVPIDDPTAQPVGTYIWESQPDPMGNPVVFASSLDKGLKRTIKGHAQAQDITYKGKTYKTGWEVLDLGPNMVPYNLTDAGVGGWSPATDRTIGFCKTVTGIVSVQGLVTALNAGSAQVIGTLPEGFRPEVQLIFPTQLGSSANGTITVHPDGRMIVSNITAGGTYISLDNVIFPAAGVGPWIPLEGQTEYDITRFGIAAFWEDPYGTMWFRGVVAKTAVANPVLATIPAAHRETGQLAMHESVAQDNTAGGVRFSLVNQILTNIQGLTGSTAGWVSLSGTVYHKNKALTQNWLPPVALFNSWAPQGGATNTVSACLRRSDGLIFHKGLIRNGTLGSSAFNIPDTKLPRGKSMQVIVANAAPGRLYINGGNVETDKGSVIPNTGSNVWFSLDNVVYHVGGI